MNKNNNALYKVLQDYHRKRITLEELNRICSDPEQITELTEQGALVPVKKSGTNGNMKTPLFLRYTICIEKQIAELEYECRQLSRQIETERKEERRLAGLIAECDDIIGQDRDKLGLD